MVYKGAKGQHVLPTAAAQEPGRDIAMVLWSYGYPYSLVGAAGFGVSNASTPATALWLKASRELLPS